MKVQVIIPSRIGSTRLPEKNIQDICGRPMVVRVCDQVKKAGIAEVIVAVDHLKTKQIVEEYGYTAIMTDPNLASGSDRIYAAMIEMEKISGQKADIVINVQGDEPLTPPELITDTVKAFEENDWIDVLTYAHTIDNHDDLNNPNLVKLVTDENNKAHYFSRSLIPHGTKVAKRHIGFYAYKRDALEKFVNSKQSPLEIAEKLEQLRGLDIGLQYYVAMTAQAPIGVDTIEDLEMVRQIVARLEK
jgi:3-deoxy-manno-octulosonate cytidylyltransferase (CMP-KDO synthetase)